MTNKMKLYEIEFIYGEELRWTYTRANSKEEVIKRLKCVKDDVLNPNSKTHNQDYISIREVID